MDYYKFIFAAYVAYCTMIFPGNAEKSLQRRQDDTSDKLRKDNMRTIPRKETNSLLPQIMRRRLKDQQGEEQQNIAEEKKKTPLKALPSEEEAPTKKSIETSTSTNSAAFKLALMKSNVYLKGKTTENDIEHELLQEYTSNKRFNIPQTNAQTQKNSDTSSKLRRRRSKMLESKQTTSSNSGPVFPDYKVMFTDDRMRFSNGRAKRQEDNALDQQLPMADSVADNPTRTDSTYPFNAVIPTSNVRDQEINVRSDVNGIYENKAVVALPLKISVPVVVSSARPVSLSSARPVSLSSARPVSLASVVQATEKSTLPSTRLVQPLHRQSLKTTNLMVGSQAENLLVKLPRNENYVTTADQPRVGASSTPQLQEQRPVIKLAHVPVNILNLDTENTKQMKAELKKESISDEDTLKFVQLKLTSIISKLEEKVNQERKKEKAKTTDMKKTRKVAAREKSLRALKQKLSRVVAKFKSKPMAGQPFQLGKEWSHLLDTDSFMKEGQLKKGAVSEKVNSTGSTPPKEESKEGEGNWPSVASQLLRKLNKALAKLQERKVARALVKNAVMYFSFNEAKAAENSDGLIPDKSGHFNDATVSNRAHISSRTYGSCGKALILNSGNLRYVDKYLKTQPTKAITLAMWVRTNATGYVRWFARDSGPSREFNTITQYPLVRKNVWTHLCGTFNSSTGITRIYVDGELKTEKVNKRESAIPADFTPAGIGSKFGDDNLIAVDEVYMFAKALGEKEVRALYDDCEFNRMVLHYGFQKINRTAGVVFDQSGLNNNAELRGDANILDSGCDKCGSCLDLNAKDDPRLTIQGSQFKHRPTKAISLAAWVNLNSTAGTHPLFKVKEPFTKSPVMDLHVTDGRVTWKAHDKNHNTLFYLSTEQTVVPEGIWVHILVTFDSVSGSARIFVDGHQKALSKAAKKVPIGEEWGETLIGGKSIGSQVLGGYMDELVMYNWELDSSEISYVMKYCPDHPKLVSFTVHIPLE